MALNPVTSSNFTSQLKGQDMPMPPGDDPAGGASRAVSVPGQQFVAVIAIPLPVESGCGSSRARWRHGHWVSPRRVRHGLGHTRSGGHCRHQA